MISFDYNKSMISFDYDSRLFDAELFDGVGGVRRKEDALVALDWAFETATTAGKLKEVREAQINYSRRGRHRLYPIFVVAEWRLAHKIWITDRGERVFVGDMEDGYLYGLKAYLEKCLGMASSWQNVQTQAWLDVVNTEIGIRCEP